MKPAQEVLAELELALSEVGGTDKDWADSEAREFYSKISALVADLRETLGS